MMISSDHMTGHVSRSTGLGGGVADILSILIINLKAKH